MTNIDQLMATLQVGFNTLNVSDKYKDAALNWLKTWLTDAAFTDYVPQIKHLVAQGAWEFLLDAFYQIIPFGTGGRRGLVGVGPNRINPWTIQASAQGHSQYLKAQHGESAREKGVVLTYDVRRYTDPSLYHPDLPNPIMNLDGQQLVDAAAAVYAANGIKVYVFDGVRSTPELSFAVRHLGAASGDMFSASHNLPTDNGKKVYDQYGGQLIPPHDQALVDEVTQRVDAIKTMDLAAAREKGLIVSVGDDVDAAYMEAVCAVSLSDARGLKILYSPLHGTGMTSVFPVLNKLGFDVALDASTANLSGAFENVMFNIPNPEVIESFKYSRDLADEASADIILSTDPDADRIGVMVRHAGDWMFLNGNEIGVLLSHYAVTKYAARGLLSPDSIIVSTLVTTSLIDEIARKNNVRCKGDLLVGFKYIAEEMNQLEKEGRMADFLMGTEESHGYITGNYCRDKDAAAAAIWIAEFAAELKATGQTLMDALDRIYAEYGYCHNHLTEIRLLGAEGMEQIMLIMDHFRNETVTAFGELDVADKRDRWQGDPQPHLSATDTASRNVLIFTLHNVPETAGMKITVRPSGTEPKIKMYFEVIGTPCDISRLGDVKKQIVAIREKLEKTFMTYCYQLLGIDFPDRGFLLFWQLPLTAKLRYFDIEEKIAGLAQVQDPEERKTRLAALMGFLGANPVEKVDRAFTARYGKGIQAHLGLS